MPYSAYAQLSGAAAQPVQLDGVGGLSLAPQLVEHPSTPGEPPAVFGLGASSTGTIDQNLRLKGDAQLRRGASVVKADVIHYNVDTDTADAYGNVHLVNDGNVFIGPNAHLQVGATEGMMTMPKYHFNLTNGSGHGTRIDLLDDQRETIYDGTYTTCQCVAHPSWYFKSSRLDLDNSAGEGVVHNGVLFFEGMPLFASPWISFPLNGERQSGLLPPTFQVSSTNGVDISVPIYFNLAPNYDLTLTPRLMTSRGAMLTTNYRYLTPTYAGQMSVAYLPHDEITDTTRYSISYQHKQTLGDGFAVYANYNRVSDANVLSDLGSVNSFTLGTQTIFQQEAGVTYNHGPWSVLTRVQNWQSFTTGVPYNRAPEIDAKYTQYNVAGFDFGADANATRFTIPVANSTEGDRLTFDPYVSYPIERPGWSVTPKFQWHFASYDLSSIGSGAPVGQPKTFSFNVPTLSLDSKAVFERNVSLFGVNMIQTLEPRLYYVYTPYRNQTFAPIFDTAPLDFGLDEMFTDNAFVGGDRVADMNRITAAVTTRFLDSASGEELARFVLGQEYYFSAPQVTMPYNTLPTVGPANLIEGASLNIGDNMSIQQAVEYNQSSDEFTQAEAGIGWKPGDGKVINAAYIYTAANATFGNGTISQVLLSGQWPLTRRLSGVGLIDYDTKAHQLISGLIGMQYSSDCWAVSLALEKYVFPTDTLTPTTGTRVLMQLQLNGLARIDNGLLQQFKASVPGYTTTPAPVPQSPFSNYP